MDFHCRVKFYVLFTCVKNTHVNSFHCCVKSFCCAAFFTYVYVRFRPTNALDPGLKTKRAGIWFERQEKNGGSSEQAFAPSFLPSPEAKEKAKIQKKVLDKGYISKPFSTWRIPHASGTEMHENDHESFYKYFRMTPERFDNLLLLVGPMLTKKSLYREPISAGERLPVTLRFLATRWLKLKRQSTHFPFLSCFYNWGLRCSKGPDISSLLLLTKPLHQNTSPCSMNLLTRWTIELNMALTWQEMSCDKIQGL